MLTPSQIFIKRIERTHLFPLSVRKIKWVLRKTQRYENATVQKSIVNIYDEMQDVIVRTRSYTIINSDELQEALKNMRNDIGARILDMALYQSGLMVV